jgi:hypothetical protein
MCVPPVSEKCKPHSVTGLSTGRLCNVCIRMPVTHVTHETDQVGSRTRGTNPWAMLASR